MNKQPRRGSNPRPSGREPNSLPLRHGSTKLKYIDPVRNPSLQQHVELSTSRRLRDYSDLKKLTEWFEEHDTFDTNLTDLRSLSSGLTASEEDDVNCDDAENVGQAIQIKLYDLCFEDAKLKRSDQIRTLSRLQDGVKLNNVSTYIDPLVLFGRLTALVQRQEDIPSQFFYELTPEPTSLFKDGLMRKPTKSTLRNHFLKNIPSTTSIAKSCVVGGGALLHEVQWLPKCTYNELADHFVNFVKRKYGKHDHICVVFDGYDDTLSTKTHEHVRRKGTASSNVNITYDSMQVTAKR